MKALFVVFLLALASCAADQVQYARQQPNVDFTAYKTFNFLDATARNDAAYQSAGVGIEPLKQAIGREMTRRGYQLADRPDVWVNIGVVTQDKVQTRETNLLQDAPRYIGQRNYHWQSQEVVTGHYEEGTATVELVDAVRQEVVWQGAVKSILSPNPDKLTKRIDDAMAELFAKYPVLPAR